MNRNESMDKIDPKQKKILPRFGSIRLKRLGSYWLRYCKSSETWYEYAKKIDPPVKRRRL